MGDDRLEPASGADAARPVEQDQSPAGQSRDELGHDALEQEARENLRTFGELGGRVRDVLARASTLWAETTPTEEADTEAPPLADPAHDLRARALARRWVGRDFLVDPELPQAMTVTELAEAALWRVDVIERGETRTLSDALEPYRGEAPGAPGPILPVWDYTYATVPEIDSGEHRERLPATALLTACAPCNGSGHRACAACGGNGFLQCLKCHGRARTVCRRCRGRGIIADDAAERRARAGHGYWQVQAERMTNDAAVRLADFAERLRQEHGVPLPPAVQWAPVAPASGVTMPCPDCQHGAVACACRSGKVICDICRGSGHAECTACAATGRVIRHRELVRRFDTRIAERVVPPATPEMAEWLRQHFVRRISADVVWEGDTDALADTDPPAGVPGATWTTARQLAAAAPPEGPGEPVTGERRVLTRRVRLVRMPFTRVEYTFAGRPFAFIAVGTPTKERFWAQSFPVRWARVGRFLRAVMRDLAAERPERSATASGEISTLAEYRERRMREQPHTLHIASDEAVDRPTTDSASTEAYGGMAEPGAGERGQ